VVFFTSLSMETSRGWWFMVEISMIPLDETAVVPPVGHFMSVSGISTKRIHRRRLFTAAAMAMFVFGMLVSLLGTLFGLPAMRERLGVDLAQQGDLFSVLFLGLFGATAVVGPLLDRYGCKLVVVSGSAMVTAALAAFALARGFGAAAVAALLLGFGGGWLNTASNALVSEVFPDDRGRMLNLLGIFFGVGALFAPLLVSIGFEALSVAGVMAVCAGVAGASTVASAGLTFPPPHEGAAFSVRGMVAVAGSQGVLLFAALLMFESGNEAALSGWTSTYVGAMGWSPRVATLVLLGYWVMAIVGRAASARVQARTGLPRLVVGSSLVAVVGCTILLMAASWLPGLVAGAWLTALGFSAIFQTVLAMAGDRYQRFAGTVFGLLFTVGNLGSISFPWALGHISQSAGMRLGMLVPLAGTVLVTICAVTIARATPRTRPVRA
jgi:MFS transporter, FHS family, glucose/mannose:H+ symporter